MAKEWVRLALGNAGFLNGIFLSSSRHLSKICQQLQQQQQFTNLAIRYKLVCVRALSDAISSGAKTMTFSDSVVAETMVLAFDEVSVQRIDSNNELGAFPIVNSEFSLQISLGDLAMSRRHVQGAVRMVELNGGSQTLGLNGFLEMVLHKYVDEVGLLGRVSSPPCGGAFGGNFEN